MSLTSYRAAPPRVGWEATTTFQKAVARVAILANGFFMDCTGDNAWRRPTLPTLER